MDPVEWTFCRFIDYRGFFHVSSNKTKFGDYAEICYTTEALFYTQTAFMVAIINA